MRVLLAQNSLYYPSHGGGDKSNRLLMEALAERRHHCRVVARLGGTSPEDHDRFLADLNSRDVPVIREQQGIVVLRHQDVEVHVATHPANIRGYFSGEIERFDPSVILTSTDDPAQVLLEAAIRSGKSKVVYLARATLAVPFGPDSAFPSASKTETLRQVDSAVGVSEYVAEYLRRWGGLNAVHVPISLMERGPYPFVGAFENEYVTFVNPCAVKGISVFLALAARMPDVAFAAVPTWGTSREDLEALSQHRNVHVLAPTDDVDELFSRTRVLLVPSLWAEARSRIIPEAMLRGIPVLAANVGGIPEAMLGTDYLLPVRPIERYQRQVDQQMVPIPEVPEQEIGPWETALRRLISDKGHYQQLSLLSRERALAYVENLSVRPFESYLEEVLRTSKKRRADSPTPAPKSVLESLSPEKRRLLALRLRSKNAGTAVADQWFPSCASQVDSTVRFFLFPAAGGGTAAFRGWNAAFPSDVALCPARFPGRESRQAETAFRDMEALVVGTGEAILPYLDRPYALFGHSMGAAIAFELARWLRRHGRILPMALFVSGARAPRFRLGHVPPPELSDEELLSQVDRLEGVPEGVRRSPELMQLILQPLRADAALYRNYAYKEESPLEIPIRAYGGLDDPNVGRQHLDAWAGETTAGFAARMFPGGHFFIESSRAEFLAALSADLAELR